MTVTTVSSREFQQNANRAQKAAERGPVVITRHGKPAYVLLSYEEYRALTRSKRTIVEALSEPDLSDIEIDFPVDNALPRPADFQ